VVGCDGYGNEPWASINDEEFIASLSDCYLLKECFVPWN
jgi:hypothetical protein